ncbi:MAG: class D beta-lactamase [Gammaproteobacteria bacterium]|nr:class D beta-lactamase [Gammaproteobacteria bacterium]
MSDTEKLAAVFERHSVTGTIVIESLLGDRTFVHNPDRASIEYSPASTFKIPNSLIALGYGVVDSRDSEFKWDGKDKGRSQWNQDQTLESAFKVSCVWCYQEIARAVGAQRYAAALRDLNYGNREIGNEVDTFWLNGDLAISAWGQIEFLRSFHREETGHSLANVALVKDIMRVEQTDAYSLHAKSGWTGSGLHTGWYVGYVTTPEKTWLFALNMDMEDASQAPLRHDVTVQALQALDII